MCPIPLAPFLGEVQGRTGVKIGYYLPLPPTRLFSPFSWWEKGAGGMRAKYPSRRIGRLSVRKLGEGLGVGLISNEWQLLHYHAEMWYNQDLSQK